jgi:hypothetical protein
MVAQAALDKLLARAGAQEAPAKERPVGYHAHDADGARDTARVEVPTREEMWALHDSTKPFVIRWRGGWWRADGASGVQVEHSMVEGRTVRVRRFFVLIGRDRLTKIDMRLACGGLR